LTDAPLIRIEKAVKSFGGLKAVDDVSLDVGAGEFLALLGPSGCGKTTLLRSIAGLETLDGGRIAIDGRDMTGEPAYRRPVNLMFQSYALFPHLTVAGNIAFGLKQEDLPRGEIERRVGEALALVRLEDKAGHKPERLSGGQQQRVALARALAKRPRALLLDEPLAALDRKLRAATRSELVGLQRRLGIAFVMVTHDQEEALSTATRIAVMERGRIVQIGTAADVYERPRNRWVATFIGEANVIEARRTAEGRWRAETLGIDLVLAAAPGGRATATLVLRPERVRIDVATAPNKLDAVVIEAVYLGGRIALKARVPTGAVLLANVASADGAAARFTVGSSLSLGWTAEAATVLEE
jgi:putrescine transport system ATP-binding protein